MQSTWAPLTDSDRRQQAEAAVDALLCGTDLTLAIGWLSHATGRSDSDVATLLHAASPIDPTHDQRARNRLRTAGQRLGLDTAGVQTLDLRTTFAGFTLRHRLARAFTPEVLAGHLGLSTAVIEAWERGLAPSRLRASDIAVVFDVDIETVWAAMEGCRSGTWPAAHGRHAA